MGICPLLLHHWPLTPSPLFTLTNGCWLRAHSPAPPSCWPKFEQKEILKVSNVHSFLSSITTVLLFPLPQTPPVRKESCGLGKLKVITMLRTCFTFNFFSSFFFFNFFGKICFYAEIEKKHLNQVFLVTTGYFYWNNCFQIIIQFKYFVLEFVKLILYVAMTAIELMTQAVFLVALNVLKNQITRYWALITESDKSIKICPVLLMKFR